MEFLPYASFTGKTKGKNKPAAARVNTFKPLSQLRKECASKLLDDVIRGSASMADFNRAIKRDI